MTHPSVHTSFVSRSLVLSVTSPLMSCHPTRSQRCRQLEIESEGDTGGGWEGLIRGRIRGGERASECSVFLSVAFWGFQGDLSFHHFFFSPPRQPNKLPQKWGQGEHVCVWVWKKMREWKERRGNEEVFLNSDAEGRGRENSLREGDACKAVVVGSDELRRDKNDLSLSAQYTHKRSHTTLPRCTLIYTVCPLPWRNLIGLSMNTPAQHLSTHHTLHGCV